MKIFKRVTLGMFFLASALALALTDLRLSQAAIDAPWEDLGESDGIHVWSRSVPNSDIVAFKGQAVIDAPIAKVATVLNDTERRLEWVHAAKEVRRVKDLSLLERIEYNHTSVPWPLRDRDFLYHARIWLHKARQEVLVELRSMEDPSVPERPDCCVRGQITESTYHIASVDGGRKTRVTVVINADPKGAVPKWVINLFQKSWPRKTLAGIMRQVKKPDVKEMTLVRDYFDGKLIPGVKASEIEEGFKRFVN